MPTIFICGHGTWDGNDGYTTVPKNTSISFYTETGKAMRSSDVNRLILSTYGGRLIRKVGPYRSCNNMRVFPDDPNYKASAQQDAATIGVGTFFTDQPGGITLSRIFELHPGNDFVWACCRSRYLRSHAKSNEYISPLLDTQSAEGYGTIINGVWVPKN